MKTSATSINLVPLKNPLIKSTSSFNVSEPTQPIGCNSGHSSTQEKTKMNPNHHKKDSNLPKDEIKSNSSCPHSSQNVLASSLPPSTNNDQVLIEHHRIIKGKSAVHRFLSNAFLL